MEQILKDTHCSSLNTISLHLSWLRSTSLMLSFITRLAAVTVFCPDTDNPLVISIWTTVKQSLYLIVLDIVPYTWIYYWSEVETGHWAALTWQCLGCFVPDIPESSVQCKEVKILLEMSSRIQFMPSERLLPVYLWWSCSSLTPACHRLQKELRII